MKLGRALAVLGLGSAPAGCEKHVASVDVPCFLPLTTMASPSNVALAVGERVRVVARVIAACPPVTETTFTWEVRDMATATVEAAPDSAGASVAILTGRASAPRCWWPHSWRTAPSRPPPWSACNRRRSESNAGAGT